MTESAFKGLKEPYIIQPPNDIFVFGSNLAGYHGAGAAKTAMRDYGARRGVAFGIQGNSYAIPTKDWCLRTLPLSKIEPFVKLFLAEAEKRKELTFKVTKIGCGFAGYKPSQIAPMFVNRSSNVLLPEEFLNE